MNSFTITIDIAAPPERVWAIMSEVERWHEWTPTVKSVKRLGNGPVGIGSKVIIRQPKLPRAVWKVTEFTPGHVFTWISTGPGILVTAKHFVVPNAGGSRATLSIHYSGIIGSLMGRMLANLNNRYLAIEANGLKRRSENNSYVIPTEERLRL